MMTTVKLYGKLGKLFGRTWKLDVNSPREAVCAIDANRPGLAAYLTRNSLPGYHVIVGDRDRDEEELDLATAGRTIKIIPYVKGRNTGWGKIVAGIVLIAVGYASDTPTLMTMGFSMLFGGVAQLLTKPPTLEQPNEKEKSRPSYSFDGPINTTAQGWPMPVGYGTLRVGGAVVSMSIDVYPYFTGYGDAGETGFRILSPQSVYTCWQIRHIVYPNVWLWSTEGVEDIVWSITSQSAGNFFSIAPNGADTTWGVITWIPTIPIQDHILTIHAVDANGFSDDVTITISIVG